MAVSSMVGAVDDEPGAARTQLPRALSPKPVSFVIDGASRAEWEQTKEPSAMTTSRVQLALNVTDLEAATRFYTDLFGVKPAKQRTGYANFVIADPPLKLVLFENPGAASPLNHLGVEVASTGEVVAAAKRFTAAGMAHSFAESDRCCHAVQDKVWVDAPDVPLGGWEFYTVLADDPGQDTGATTSVCCGEGSTEGGACGNGGGCGA
jgi:catechol 2,3-dioxygenase-like lactoylglutathione lyase family enzyme